MATYWVSCHGDHNLSAMSDNKSYVARERYKLMSVYIVSFLFINFLSEVKLFCVVNVLPGIHELFTIMNIK